MVQKIYVFIGFHRLCLLTVLSRVSDDHIRLRPSSKLIPGLDFDLVRHVGFCVVDDVFGPHGGHVAPLLSRILPSPPNVVVQVWAIPLQIKQRLEKNNNTVNAHWLKVRVQTTSVVVV